MKINILTDAGKTYLQNAIATNTPLKISSIKVGSGNISDLNEAKALTNLKVFQKNLGVLETSKAGNDIVIKTPLNNLGVTTAFHLREIGIFVLNPDNSESLFWYMNHDNESNYINTEDLGVIRVDLAYRLVFGSEGLTVVNANTLDIFVTKDYLDTKIAETVGGDLSDKLSKSLGGVVEKKTVFKEGIDIGVNGNVTLRHNPESGNLEFIFKEGV